MIRNMLLGACAVGFLAPAVHAESLPLKKSEGFTSPIHKKHAGKILFSTKPVPRAPKTDADFTTTFTLGKDAMYARVFTKDSLDNLLRATGKTCYREERAELWVTVNGGDPIELESTLMNKKPMYDWMSWSFGKSGKKHFTEKLSLSGKTDYRHRFSSHVISTLKEGANTLVFTAQGECIAKGDSKKSNWDAAKATITLNVPKGGVAKYYKKNGPHLPKHAFKGGKKLFKAMKKAVNAKWAQEDVLSIRTIAKDWYVKVERLTRRPLARSMATMTVVRKKGAAKCRVFFLDYWQQAKGGKKFDKAMTFSTGRSYDFPCSNVSK